MIAAKLMNKTTRKTICNHRKTSKRNAAMQ